MSARDAGLRSLITVLLLGVLACGDDTPLPVSDDGKLVLAAEASPASTNVGQSFTVEVTLTNRTAATVSLPSSDGCRLGFEVRTASGAPVVAPRYVCIGPIDSLALVPGAVVRESYGYQPGTTGFPRLEAGRYQLLPSVVVRDPSDVLIRTGTLQVR